MIQIGDFQIDIAGILTVVSSIGACLFAFLTWYNQTKTKLSIVAEPIVPHDSPYFKFPSTSEGELRIANMGYKTTSVIEISLGIRKKMISVHQIFDFDKKVITICPGEIKCYKYPIDGFVQYISNSNFKQNDTIWWAVRTSDNKIFKYRTHIKVADVLCEKENHNDKA